MKSKSQKENVRAEGRTKFGLELEQSAKEILEHLRGEAKLTTRRIVFSDTVNVRGPLAREAGCDDSRLFGCDHEES